MDSTKLNDFATRYTAAWCSHNASGVTSFFEVHGSLKMNEERAAVGRSAIAAVAQGFMTAFPDLIVEMDKLEASARALTYRWTLIGTNTGPEGKG